MLHVVTVLLEYLTDCSSSRHSSIQDFVIDKNILRIFPNRTLAQNNSAHLTWGCSDPSPELLWP